MSQIYCGIGKIPKSSRLGSMKECAEKKQIRYYGVKKVDSKLIEATKTKKKKSDYGLESPGRRKLLSAMGSLRGKIKNIKRRIESEKNKDKKKDLETELAELNDKLKVVLKNFSEFEKKRKELSRSSKKGSSRKSKSRKSRSKKSRSRKSK